MSIKGIVFFVPLQEGNNEEQVKKWQNELEQARKLLASTEKKLGNQGFIENAKPEVVERERKKQQDAKLKIQELENLLK